MGSERGRTIDDYSLFSSLDGRDLLLWKAAVKWCLWLSLVSRTWIRKEYVERGRRMGESLGLCPVCQVTVSQLNCRNSETVTMSLQHTLYLESWDLGERAAWLSVDLSYCLSLHCVWVMFLGVIYHLLNHIILGWILTHLSVKCWTISGVST